MVSTIRTKLSATPGKVPLVGDLVGGELAMNTNDAILFMKKTVLGVDSVVRVGAEMSPTVSAALKETTGAAFFAALGGDAALELIQPKTASGTEVAFTGLSAFREVMFCGFDLTTSTSVIAMMQVGHSGGYLAAEYRTITSNQASFFLSTSQTGARGFSVQVAGFNKTAAFKPAFSNAGVPAVGILTSLALDRVRFYLSGAGNWTAGTIYAFGRRG